jgi:acetolactate synthase-1/3 small subunit
MNMKHTISVLVENEFGVLTRIAGLFSGRGYNIESLSVAPTLDASLSRMTIVTSGTDHVMEQIIKQLNKLLNVVKVQDVTSENPINRILGMIKINLTKRNEDKLLKIIKPYDAKIIYSDDKCSIIQAVAEEEALAKLIELVTPYGIMEFISTGNIAMQKGRKVIKA